MNQITPVQREQYRLHPCDKCHLKPREVCDICGAANLTPMERLTETNEQLLKACVLLTRAMCSLGASDFGGGKDEVQRLHAKLLAVHRDTIELIAVWDNRLKGLQRNHAAVLDRRLKESQLKGEN